MPRRSESVTLEDPRALRALAHPARQQLVNELFGGRVLTATEAADVVGLTPSAVSHHLRVLERWGLAERAPATGDGRERPWRGTGRVLRLRAAPGPAGQAAMQSVMSLMMGEFAAQVDSFTRTIEDEPWRGAYQGFARGELWLTEDETRDLSARMQQLVDEFDRRRTHARHPRGARRSTFTWSLLPAEPAPDATGDEDAHDAGQPARSPG